MSRRLSNGRSPLVNKQSQITFFFSPGKTPPNPNPTPKPGSKGDPKKTTPDPVKNDVGRRIRVFWPLDGEWYEGRVVEERSGKHLVRYDDGEEEELDLGKEKVGWVGEEKVEVVEEEAPVGFKRLRRRGSVVENDGESSDSDDKDWRKEELEDEDVEMEMEMEEEKGSRVKRARSGVEGLESLKRNLEKEGLEEEGVKKRGSDEVGGLGSVKKVKVGKNGGKVCPVVSPVVAQPKSSPHVDKGYESHAIDSSLVGDAAERFGKRDSEKFRFLSEGRKDAKKRSPKDPNYDPRTLFLPPDFLKSLSGAQRQWWEFKSKHMDKVLFFKMGKFYELFEMDAHIGARELDLQYMKGDQPHCGFPEKNFSINLEKLARKRYRVLVVEQTETPDQLELRRKEGSKDKVVKREICAMVTKGTLMDGELLSTNPDSSYLMSLTEICPDSDNHNGHTIIGVCVVDVSTSKFILGQFEDGPERNCLCALLSELRPVEIIKPLKMLSSETEGVLHKHTRKPLFNDLLPFSEFWDAERTIIEITKIYKLLGDDSDHLPHVLSELMKGGDSRHCALSALGGCIFYLRQAFLDETLLRCAEFEPLPCSNFHNFQKQYMVLDAAALENLEILENSKNGSQSGSLFSQLDHCVTAFGKRLLKNWLVRPLYSSRLIIERQDAISGLKESGFACGLEFRKDLTRLPDMERLLSRLFSSYEASGRNANKVVLYEDAAKKRLKEFTAALRGCELMAQACSSLASILDNNNSTLLHRLLTPGKGLPDIFPELKHFRDAFDWSEADQLGRIIPHIGGDPEYDSVCKMIKDVEVNLKKYLEKQRKLLGDSSINYVTVGKDTYLLEIPEDLRPKIPRDYELQSSKKGYFRYRTPKIKEWLLEHSQAEAEKESKLKSILHRFIGHFSEHHSKWRQLVSTVAELDVLISLAMGSNYYEGPTCRPTIITSSLDESTPSLCATSLGHPLLQSDSLGNGSFVPNDVSIGGAKHPNFILLTGPNMGGKSTLIRQICLAVILAQIGADVPAETFALSPVDRMFIRMGAQDHIMAGQSTFLTELSETASMLSCATHKSLVALDELGRGTSTSDGQAIAESVLEYFIHNIKCRGMFSTHYHHLAVNYEKSAEVSLCHMACQVGKGDEGVEEVTFLYRLTAGSCPKSFGVNVARLAGLPAPVLKKAAEKSRDFEATYGKHGSKSATKSSNIIGDNELALIKDILKISVSADCNENPRTPNVAGLKELQQRAKFLVLQN